MARVAFEERDERPWHDLGPRYRLGRLLWRSRRYQVFEALELSQQQPVVVTLAQDLEPEHVLSCIRALKMLGRAPSDLIPEIRDFDAFNEGRLFVVTRAARESEPVERLLQEQRPLALAVAARLVIGLSRGLDAALLECSVVRGLSSAFVNLVRAPHGGLALQLTMVGLMSDIELCEMGEWPGMEAQQLCWLFARLAGADDPASVPGLAAVFQRALSGPEGASRRDVVAALAPLAARVSGTVPVTRR